MTSFNPKYLPKNSQMISQNWELGMKFLHLVLCPWIYSSVSWFIIVGNLNRICTLLLCKHCIHLTYVELIHSAFQDFPGGSDSKASAYNVGNPGLISGSGRSPGGENGNQLQYSWLENPMDRRAWGATVHRVAKNQTQLRDWAHSTYTEKQKDIVGLKSTLNQFSIIKIYTVFHTAVGYKFYSSSHRLLTRWYWNVSRDIRFKNFMV